MIVCIDEVDAWVRLWKISEAMGATPATLLDARKMTDRRDAKGEGRDAVQCPDLCCGRSAPAPKGYMSKCRFILPGVCTASSAPFTLQQPSMKLCTSGTLRAI